MLPQNEVGIDSYQYFFTLTLNSVGQAEERMNRQTNEETGGGKDKPTVKWRQADKRRDRRREQRKDKCSSKQRVKDKQTEGQAEESMNRQ